MTSRRPPFSVAAIVLLAAGLAGCATPGPAASGPDVVAPVGPAPSGSFVLAGPDAPISFVDRVDLPSCGHEKLGQGDVISDAAVECLVDHAADGAELIVTAPTVEGDPIVTYYRALPGGGIEVFTDMTQDAYGGGWGHSLCPEARTVLDLGTCVEAPESDHEAEH